MKPRPHSGPFLVRKSLKSFEWFLPRSPAASPFVARETQLIELLIGARLIPALRGLSVSAPLARSITRCLFLAFPLCTSPLSFALRYTAPTAPTDCPTHHGRCFCSTLKMMSAAEPSWNTLKGGVDIQLETMASIWPRLSYQRHVRCLKWCRGAPQRNPRRCDQLLKEVADTRDLHHEIEE